MNGLGRGELACARCQRHEELKAAYIKYFYFCIKGRGKKLWKGFVGDQPPHPPFVYQGLCPDDHTVTQSSPPVEEPRMKEKQQERGDITWPRKASSLLPGCMSLHPGDGWPLLQCVSRCTIVMSVFRDQTTRAHS